MTTPLADLLDRTLVCPTCKANPGQPCQPRMPFSINHINRNPTSQAKYNQHHAFEALRDEGRLGIICECCGRHTGVPAGDGPSKWQAQMILAGQKRMEESDELQMPSSD